MSLLTTLFHNQGRGRPIGERESGVVSLLPFTDTFTQANGPLVGDAGGWTYNSGIWSVTGNAAVCNPTLGAELWDAAAATFVTGTYSWVAQGGNTIANVSGTLQITYVNSASGAKDLFADAADLSSNLTVGGWYQFGYTAWLNAIGNASMVLNDGVSLVTQGSSHTTTTPTARTMTFRAMHATAAYVQQTAMSASEVLYLDNLSLKPLLPLSDLFCTRDLGTSNIDISVPVTQILGRGAQTGLVACLDSASSPSNFLIAHHDGIFARLDKCVNGVYSSVISATATYAAGGVVRLVKNGTSCSLYYNGTQVGTTQTVSDGTIINNTRHGLFSTSPILSMASFTAVAP